MEDITISYKKILLDLQLDLCSSARIYFNHFMICREYEYRIQKYIRDNKLNGLFAEMDLRESYLTIYKFRTIKTRRDKYKYVDTDKFVYMGEIIEDEYWR